MTHTIGLIKMLEQKTFMILKEAETLDYIPLKVTSSMGLKNTPVCSIISFFLENDKRSFIDSILLSLSSY